MAVDIPNPNIWEYPIRYVYNSDTERKCISTLADKTNISVINIRLGHSNQNNVYPYQYSILGDIISLLTTFLRNTMHITTIKVWFDRNIVSSRSAAEKFNFSMLDNLICLVQNIRSIRYLFVQGYEYHFLQDKLNLQHHRTYDVLNSLEFNARQHALRTKTLFDTMIHSKYVKISPFKCQFNLVLGAFYIVKKKGKEHSFFQFQFHHELSEALFILKSALIDKKNRKTKYVAYICVNYVVRRSRYVQNELSLKRIRIPNHISLDNYNYMPADFIPK